MKRGVLIAVEGINTRYNHDLAQTVTNKIKETLSKIKVVDHSSIFDQSILLGVETNISPLIQQYATANLSKVPLVILNSAHRWEYYDEVLNNLEKGNNVIISNYTSESVLLNQQYHYDINWIKILDNNLLLPDYIITVNTKTNQLNSYLDSLIPSSNNIKITSDDSEQIIQQCTKEIQRIITTFSPSNPIQRINFKSIKDFDYSSFSTTSHHHHHSHREGEKRGMFIVFEGCDRSGKSTQVELLKQHFKKSNLKFEHFIFPNRTTIIGKCINKFLSKELKLNAHSIHMLFAANRWEMKSQLEDALYSGSNIIVDRYAFSGIVYSSAKHIPDMSLNWCINPDCGIPQPDLIIFMDIKPSICSNRAEFGNEVYETNAFQQEVYEQYKILFKGYVNTLYVDASQSIDSIHKVILHSVMSKINDVQKKVILPITPTVK